MKIVIGTDGTILQCYRNSVELSNSIVVPDDIEVFMDMDKFIYVNGVFKLKPYLVGVPSAASATIGTTISVSISAYTSDSTLDLSARGTVRVLDPAWGTILGETELVDGVGSVSMTSQNPGTVYLSVSAPGRYSIPAVICWTVPPLVV